ncbi:uncharacterized protein [Drosophila pseudoobscura]|uniref:Cytochrome b561 domain-containing protein n=1 Tax=Drosophila pseudoobscura pseudoobscura TaxID=46245 RepID=Q29CM0_DROPS|nr:uncharacterized protein LOC4811715 [Drosophila pseudoobscura]
MTERQEEASLMENTTLGNIILDEFTWDFMAAIFDGELYSIIVEIVAQTLLIAIGVAIATKCLVRGLVRTAEHAFYCVLGLFLAVGEALLFRHSWWLVRMIGMPSLELMHSTLGLLGFWSGCIGVLPKLRQWSELKRRHGHTSCISIKHCLTKHGLCGLMGLLLTLGCLLSGLALLGIRNVSLHWSHRILGLSGFFCSICSQWFAFNSGFARREWRENQIKLFKLGSLATIITVAHFELWSLARDVVYLMPKSTLGPIGVKEEESS